MMEFEIRSIGGVIGVEVIGFDLTASHPVSELKRLSRTIGEKCLVRFRDQALSAPQLAAFAASLGPAQETPSHQTRYVVPGAPHVQLVSSALGEQRYSGHGWHSDFSYLEAPAAFTCFYMRKTPSVGGDTAFANMYAAYDALSDRMKAMIDGLDAVHNNAYRYRLQYVADDAGFTKADLATQPPVVHPMVKTHPLTGRKALYVSETLTESIIGLPPRESMAILDFMSGHCARPEFGYRHVWRPHDLIVIDNRCTAHCAIADYDMDEGREILICGVASNAVSRVPTGQLA